MNNQRRYLGSKQLENDLERMRFIEEAGLDPSGFAVARMSETPGFELPHLAQAHFLNHAALNIARRKHWRPPQTDPARELVLGLLIEMARCTIPVSIPTKHPCRLLVVGASGSGKTNLILNLLKLLRKLKIKILVWEYKPEIRRIIPVWMDAILFTPRTAPWQFLKPVGPDKLAYFIGIISEIRQEFELRPETVPLMWGVVERMLRGMQPDDPPFSWEDLRRVLEHEAVTQKRENLFTAARAVLNICVVLGPQAAAREVPDISDRYSVIGYDMVGQDPAILRLFLGFEFTRLLFQAQEEGHTTEFRQVYVFDEGSVLFSTELMQRGVAHISAAKRFISMCRFAGTGFLIGVQNLSQLDPFVTQNWDALVVFRCASVDDAVLAAKMLGLEPTAYQELMHLPTGVAYVRAADWEQPVKIQTPLFEP